LSSSQIALANAIDAPSGSTNAIFQIATLATPIDLPVGQVSGVSLTLKQVCDVFSGQAKVGKNLAATQQVYVRADGSGTSAIFGLWLSQNCTGAGAQGKSYAFTSANGFGTTSPTWTAAFVGTLGTFTPVSGSGGIAGAVASASYSIGYISPDYVQPVVNNAAYPAKVNALAPTVANTNKHIAAIAIPSSYNNNIGFTLNNASTAPGLSTTGYPIAGFTFVDTYGCYSGTYASGLIGTVAKGNLLKAFLTSLYSTSTFATEATKIINASGFVAPPAKLVTLYKSAGAPLSGTGINGTQCPSGRT
jgi:ABC-type phosphate transport system substrate-binding protein